MAETIWQSRYVGDPRQPGNWSSAENTSWAEHTYTMPNHTDENGYEVRLLFTSDQLAQARREATEPLRKALRDLLPLVEWAMAETSPPYVDQPLYSAAIAALGQIDDEST